MQFSKENLDIPISKIVEHATNTETPRQFIRNSEVEFGLTHSDIDNMTDKELNRYIEFLDYLWDK